MSSLNFAIGPSAGFSQAHKQAPYRAYKISTRYTRDEGVSLMPVASPSNQPGAAVIQATAPYGFKIVTFECSRQGAMPAIPEPEPPDANQVLKTPDLEFDSPDLTADGRTRIYTVRGRYVYLLKVPFSIKDGVFCLGGTPADASPAATMNASTFTTGFTSTGEATGSG